MDNKVPKADITRSHRIEGTRVDPTNMFEFGRIHREGACGKRSCASIGISTSEYNRE